MSDLSTFRTSVDGQLAELARLRASNAELQSDFKTLGLHAGRLSDKIEKLNKINAELLSACELAARHMPFPDVADVLEKVIAKANPNLSEPE